MADNTLSITGDDYLFPRKAVRLINLFAFLMAFPVIVVFQNISVYVFLGLLFVLSSKRMLYLNVATNIQKLAVVFGAGAIISTASAYYVGGIDSFNRAFAVLPNYLYWGLLILFLVTNRRQLELTGIFRAITLGLFLSVIYFFVLQPGIINLELSIFKPLTRNTFAFILICYTPLAVYYLKSRVKRVFTLLVILFLGIIGFISGSRSGSILIFLGAVLTYLLTNVLPRKRFLSVIIVSLGIILFFSTVPARNIVKQLNPRTYSLIYSPENTFASDRSFLLRQAMIEKGMNLFRDHPFAGIGLNNFASTEGEIKGMFEGAELVIYKDIRTGKSAHNSYISMLSEGGLVVAVPFFLILLVIILFFFIRFNNIDPPARAVFIGVLMMAIHLYFISAILNVFAWFLIGLAAAMVYIRRQDQGAEEPDMNDDNKSDV
jgi:O-antigen ligase